MKVLFLDNDGVICLYPNYGSRIKKQIDNSKNKKTEDNDVLLRFDNFDHKAIKILNKILENTGAEYVISSDWRKKANLEELSRYYLSQGVIKPPIGMTDIFNYLDWKENGIIPNQFHFTLSNGFEMERYFEITKWLNDHPEITHWVAVDDMNLARKFKDRIGEIERTWGLENFVRTNEMEGIKKSGVKEKIIKFLK